MCRDRNASSKGDCDVAIVPALRIRDRIASCGRSGRCMIRRRERRSLVGAHIKGCVAVAVTVGRTVKAICILQRRLSGCSRVYGRRSCLRVIVAVRGIAKYWICGDIQIDSGLCRASSGVSNAGTRDDIVITKSGRLRVIGSANNRILAGSGNHDVVDQLNLNIKPVRKDARSLRTAVAGNRIVNQKRSPRARRNQPVNAPSNSRTVARNDVLDNRRVRLIE
jgi:hypothetical protein